MKIVVLDGYVLNPGDLSWDGFNRLGELVVYDRTPTDQIIERIGDAEIIFTNKTIIDQVVLDACPKLRFIGVLATGYNVVDVEAAKGKNILVSNIPSYGTMAVAQFTIALLLEVCHRVGEHSQSVHSGNWANSKDWCYWNHPLIELTGKTIGMIGFGKIAQATAKIAQAFGMKVLAYGSREIEELKSERLQYVSLDELLANSDVISLHCPLFESTRGIINKNNIAKMKDGVIIINTARGPLIVEEDLAAGLASGKVYGAGVDVVSCEPIIADNPLLKAENCIITPHIAWAAKETRERLMGIAADNLEKFLANQPVNIVNQ